MLKLIGRFGVVSFIRNYAKIFKHSDIQNAVLLQIKSWKVFILKAFIHHYVRSYTLFKMAQFLTHPVFCWWSFFCLTSNLLPLSPVRL